MVRLLIPIVAVIMIWLLFFSGMSKRLRISLSLVLVAAVLLGLYVDLSDKSLSKKLVAPEKIISCGVSGDYSYRNNYNINLCLENTAKKGQVKRIMVMVTALACEAARCEEVSTSEERISLEIASGAKVSHVQNISFRGLPLQNSEATLAWTAEVTDVWATP